MSKPSTPSETLGEAPPPTWSSEWLKRTPSCAPPDYPTTNMELCDPVGKQFKRKHPDKREERVVCRLDTVTKDQHEDLILCKAVLEFDEIEFEAYAFEVDEPLASASPIHSPLARRRAGQRWSALVTAPTSRIARIMRPVLDEACWAAFVAHANAHYRATFLAAFNGPLLRCVGRVGGAPCPRDAAVDLAAPDAANGLAHLHLDHEQDLQITCDMWKAALPPSPAAWDDGINGPLLCHLLFGVCNDPRHGAAMVRFRCGPLGLGSGAGYCTPPHCVLSSLHPSRPHTSHACPFTPHACPCSCLRPPAEYATLPKAARRGGVTCVGGTQHTGRGATLGEGWPLLQHAWRRDDGESAGKDGERS